jgi:hypothetical protein
MDRSTYVCPHRRGQKSSSSSIRSESSDTRRTDRFRGDRRDRSERVQRVQRRHDYSSDTQNGNHRIRGRHDAYDEKTRPVDRQTSSCDEKSDGDSSLHLGVLIDGNEIPRSSDNKKHVDDSVLFETPSSSTHKRPDKILRDYPRTWKDKFRKDDPKERELYSRLSKSQYRFQTEKWETQEWGKKPKGVRWASDHYRIWRITYDKYIEVMYDKVSDILNSFKVLSDRQLDFEVFAKFAYDCSSGYITPYP